MVKERSIFITALLLIFVLLVEMSIPVFASTVNLPAGTVVRLELAETVSSETAVVGQRVNFKVINEVKKSGKILINGGTTAIGEIITVDKNGALGKPGTIGIQLKSVNAIDGTVVLISASKVVNGASKQTEALIVTLILCIFGIFIKGENATLQAGSIFEATTISDLNINVNDVSSSYQLNDSENGNINSNDISTLFSEKEPIYIEIKNVLKQYILIYNTSSLSIRIGDELRIVRINDFQQSYQNIGIATVVKVQGEKIALKYKLNNLNDHVSTNDKIEYR